MTKQIMVDTDIGDASSSIEIVIDSDGHIFNANFPNQMLEHMQVFQGDQSTSKATFLFIQNSKNSPKN